MKNILLLYMIIEDPVKRLIQFEMVLIIFLRVSLLLAILYSVTISANTMHLAIKCTKPILALKYRCNKAKPGIFLTLFNAK